MKLNDLPSLPLRSAATDAAWQRVYAAACAPYRHGGAWSWAWRWARGKLGRDPVFRSLLERGHLTRHPRVVDIGCGQGLIAALLHACGEAGADSGWPAAWPPAPAARAYTGIELMRRDADRARAALHGAAFAPRFVCGDMRSTPLPAADLVVMLDVLHYIDHAAQLALLQRVRDALAPHGRLLLRVGDAGQARSFAISQWVDRLVTVVRGHWVAPTWGRPLAEWTALLQGLGFESIQALPMSQGTPFANVLLVADLQSAPQ